MALSPLKSPSGGFSRRRKGFNMTWLWIILASAGLYFGWQWFFGFNSAVQSAAAAIQQGEYQAAGQTLAKLKKKQADHPQVIEALGFLENHLGRPEAARDLYMEAINLGLTPAKSLNHLVSGERFLNDARYRQAEVEYRHTLNMKPQSAAAQLGMGWTMQARGLYPEALRKFEKALNLDPSLEPARKAIDAAKKALARGTHFYIYDTDNAPMARAIFNKEGFSTRSYQLAQYASHITGIDWKRLGKFGLEKQLEDLLPSSQVQLTINSRLQRLVAKKMGWRKGSVVVLNPKTGDILAAVNQPSFNPNDRSGRNYYKIRGNRNKPLKNRAFMGLYEPGSICKIITAAAALETHVDLSKIFPKRFKTQMKLNGKWFRDWKDHGTINSLKHAMDVSSNMGLAHVGFALGADRHYEFTNRFGFGKDIDLGFELPGGRRYSIPIATSRAPLAGDDKFSLAERACGLGTRYRITPLQAAMIAATVANKGVLMKPRLIKEVRSVNGHVMLKPEPQILSTVISEETANRLKEIMVDTVENGIGSKAQVVGIKVAGKTGTSRTKKRGQLDAWFIGFAPADDPKIAIAVLGDQEGQGMHIAAPIAGAILREWVQ